MRSRPATARAGFSLLEILLALAILGGSLALLSRIAETGTAAAREARELSIARLLCQSKLSELLLDSQATGVSPQAVTSALMQPFDSESTTPFYCTVEVQPGPMNGLLAVGVTVEAMNPDGGPALARYTLVRWMVDPALGLEELEAEEEAMREEAAAAAAGTGGGS